MIDFISAGQFYSSVRETRFYYAACLARMRYLLLILYSGDIAFMDLILIQIKITMIITGLREK